jgi:hypothetical protein
LIEGGVSRRVSKACQNLQPLGAMTALLAIWIALWGTLNGISPRAFLAALLLLGMGEMCLLI